MYESRPISVNLGVYSKGHMFDDLLTQFDGKRDFFKFFLWNWQALPLMQNVNIYCIDK